MGNTLGDVGISKSFAKGVSSALTQEKKDYSSLNNYDDEASIW